MATYARAWMDRMKKSRYRPGLYCHVGNAEALRRAVGEVPTWVAGGPNAFDPEASVPSDSGIAWARAWQGWLDVDDPGGTGLTVDVSVADSDSPSLDGK